MIVAQLFDALFPAVIVLYFFRIDRKIEKIHTELAELKILIGQAGNN